MQAAKAGSGEETAWQPASLGYWRPCGPRGCSLKTVQKRGPWPQDCAPVLPWQQRLQPATPPAPLPGDAQTGPSHPRAQPYQPRPGLRLRSGSRSAVAKRTASCAKAPPLLHRSHADWPAAPWPRTCALIDRPSLARF